MKLSIKKIDSDEFEDLYVDKDSVINILNKKVLRSSKDDYRYIVYSMIEEITEIEQVGVVMKIYFKGTQLRLQNFNTITSYVREVSKEHKNKEDFENNKPISLAIVINYYDSNIVYNKLTETDFMENYKKFLKDERIHLLFK